MPRRGGGRAARVQERTGADSVPAGPAFIRRRVMPHELLTPDGLDEIERKADQILAEVGIDINADDDRELFRAAGASVDGARVRFEPGHVRELVKTAPREFTQHARNPSKSVVLGGNNVVMVPAYGSPFVRDLAGGRRYACLDDFHNFIKLTHASPWLHHSGGTICEPVDVPVNKRHLDMVYAHVKYNDQAFLGSVTVPERARDSVEMARLLFGAEFVDANCVILGNVNVNSPLVWDNAMTGAIRAYAEANQGAIIVPFILGGAMGPVTLAGDIAQAHAEALVGVALSQLIRPGARPSAKAKASNNRPAEDESGAFTPAATAWRSNARGRSGISASARSASPAASSRTSVLRQGSRLAASPPASGAGLRQPTRSNPA